ncbi:MAG: ATP-binding cassette domain-containing protein [Pirellulaceae bacterium]
MPQDEVVIDHEINLDELIASWDPDPSELSINAKYVSHFFGEGETKKQVLFDNVLRVRRGEIVIMTGPSGSGKTTLLTLIGTLRGVQQGSLKVLGEELRGIAPEATNELRKKIGFIFQAHNLFESLTAAQNVGMSTELQGLDSKTARPRIEATLKRLGLGHRVNYKPKSLSGGQKQRVAIARGIIHQPRLILADEPTAALDAESGREVVTMFQEMARNDGCTIVIVTHDNRILDVADRIVSMVDGHIRSDVLVKRNATMCRILNEFAIFRSLTPKAISEVADKMDLRKYSAGEEIIRQGDTGQDFFVIGKGEVDIEIDGKWVNTLGKGAFFGEVSLIKQQPRNATVRAKTEVACFILTKEEFQSVIDSSTSFEQELRRALFSRQ